MDQQTPQQPTSPLTIPTPPANSGNNNPLIIGIILLVLVLSGGLVFVMISWKAAPQLPSSSNPIPSPTQSVATEEAIAAPTIIPTTPLQNNREDQDLQNISLDSDTKEFDDLNTDLQAL